MFHCSNKKKSFILKELLLFGTLFLRPGGCSSFSPFVTSHIITVLYHYQSSESVLIDLWSCHAFHTFALPLSFSFFTLFLVLPAVQQCSSD